MAAITFIVRNGQTVGRYDHGAGFCAAVKAPAAPGASAVTADRVTLNSRANTPTPNPFYATLGLLAGLLLLPLTISGCISGREPAPALAGADGGDITGRDAGAADGQKETSPPPGCEDFSTTHGASSQTPGNDGCVPIPPYDSLLLIEGQGRSFQDNPARTFETDYFPGGDSDNMISSVKVGSDTTQLKGMPANGCYGGLIKATRLSAEEIAQGEVGCSEKGYEKFVYCPQDKENRLKAQNTGILLEAYTFNDGKYQLIGTTTKILDGNDPLPVACGKEAAPFRLDVPPEFYSYGPLFFKLKLALLVSAEGKDGTQYYQTMIGIRTKRAKD